MALSALLNTIPNAPHYIMIILMMSTNHIDIIFISLIL